MIVISGCGHANIIGRYRYPGDYVYDILITKKEKKNEDQFEFVYSLSSLISLNTFARQKLQLLRRQQILKWRQMMKKFFKKVVCISNILNTMMRNSTNS